MISFKPTRGKIVIRKDKLPEETETGIIYKARENREFFTGEVLSIGLPNLASDGSPIPSGVEIGDRVVVKRNENIYEVLGLHVITPEAIMAVVSKGIDVS